MKLGKGSGKPDPRVPTTALGTPKRRPKALTCDLCGWPTRSLYAHPGDRKVRFCADCFFGDPPVQAAPTTATEGQQ